ncbi:hypothetical protein A7X89_02465 [Stenotrophomonas maltophilia]|nr:hypothetical protein A7X89_02465 [Stenotrophomonas maltophilia]
MSSIAQMAVGVCTDNANYFSRLAVFATPDSLVSDLPNISAWCYSSGGWLNQPLCRRDWRYEIRYPELNVGAYQARPQGVFFESADVMLMTAHYENTVSRVHRVRLSDGAILGWFDFNQAALGTTHINSIAMDSAGGVWFSGNDKLFKVDIAASIASNSAVVTVTYDVSAAGGSFLDISTISGTEYVICGQYLESGTPYMVVFPLSLVSNGGTFNIASRTNRYVINQRTQAVKLHGGKLFMTLNRTTGGSAVGLVHRYSLDLGAADGSSLTTPEYWWYAPSQYPEDIAFHPVTGRMWTSTEGLSSVGSDVGFLALWSSSLSTVETNLPGVSPEENHIGLYYDGAGTVAIRVNGRLFDTKSWTPSPTPSAITIGGRPIQTAGWNAGFFNGSVRNVVLRDSDLSPAQYAALVSGSYEPNSLQVYDLSLVNPGAESGDGTGWTVESGALGVRTANPLAHRGTYYFYDPANAAHLSRQRSSIPTAAEASVDAGGAWARIEWFQATFSSGADTSTAGIRALNAAQTQLLQSLQASIQVIPTMQWYRRTHSVSLPALTRYVDALISMTRATGTANDGYTDDVKVTIYAK